MTTRRVRRAAAVSCLLLGGAPALSQAGAQRAADSANRSPQPARRAWYDRLTIRGYAQLRYNRLAETNSDYTCPCDRSIGNNGAFLLRRARLVVSGDVHDRVSLYFQSDFANDVGTSQHFAQIRDLYADLALDAGKSFRLRLGQSKVPFGWETLQSSSNRIPLDRSDGINNGAPGERDLGGALLWTPSEIRQRFRAITDSGLKGTGDYGLIAYAAYNGQSANRPEANNSLHQALRITYPFELPNGQFVEVGVQGYDGNIIVTQRTTGVGGGSEFTDRRAAGTVVVYPQPLGIQAEWNIGTGPEFDRATRTIRALQLTGGYGQVMYRLRTQGHIVIPFARAQYYRGGRKVDVDARRHEVREYEFGVEWTPVSAFELTANYTIGDRRISDGTSPTIVAEKGRLIRLQAQLNY